MTSQKLALTTYIIGWTRKHCSELLDRYSQLFYFDSEKQVLRTHTKNHKAERYRLKSQLSKPGAPSCLRWWVQDKESPVLPDTTKPEHRHRWPVPGEGRKSLLHSYNSAGQAHLWGKRKKDHLKLLRKESARYAISISADKQHIYRTGKINTGACKARQPENRKLIDPKGAGIISPCLQMGCHKKEMMKFWSSQGNKRAGITIAKSPSAAAGLQADNDVNHFSTRWQCSVTLYKRNSRKKLLPISSESVLRLDFR